MSNVVNLFEARQKKEETKSTTPDNGEGLGFEEIMKKNKENEERLKRERANANKGVVRSHRLK